MLSLSGTTYYKRESEHYCRGGKRKMNTIDTTTDLYILKNKDGEVYGNFEVEKDFDVLKLKDMSLMDALIFLDKEGVYYKARTGALGTLTFK